MSAQYQLIEETPPAIRRIIARSRLDMRAIVDETEFLLPWLLQDRKEWQSKYIDYQPPHLMRISCQIGLIRANLHYFLPVTSVAEAATNPKDINLYHPHPWAAGFRILEGRYQQYFGRATKFGIDDPPERTRVVLQDANGRNGENRYQMVDPLEWHQVIPFANGKAVSTLMVTYIPKNWEQKIPPPSTKQRCLTPQELDFMFAHFAKLYPAPNGPGIVSRGPTVAAKEGPG